MIWGMMLARLAFISLPHNAFVGPFATRSRMPMRSFRTNFPRVLKQVREAVNASETCSGFAKPSPGGRGAQEANPMWGVVLRGHRVTAVTYVSEARRLRRKSPGGPQPQNRDAG